MLSLSLLLDKTPDKGKNLSLVCTCTVGKRLNKFSLIQKISFQDICHKLPAVSATAAAAGGGGSQP